jgi:glycosyltransferase involved in cell wall biosynthesis
MKIAQVAPLYESVPPQFYGGTERVVSYLTEELVHAGHEVTLFASGDSTTRAHHVAPPLEHALRLSGESHDSLIYHYLLLEEVAKRAAKFDVVHFHTDYLHFPLARRMFTPHLTTLHGRLDLPDLAPLFDEFSDMPVVSISNDQRRPLRRVNWLRTVYHGIPPIYRFQSEPDGYLAFLGRISPEKGVDRAVEIARRTGLRLRIAAKVDGADHEYFAEIKALLANPWVEFIGEISDAQKSEFLGGARALLFPINWPEPFGLVIIEAMACGTPVVAFRRGSVPEIVDHGATGFIVDGVDDAVKAVERIGQLSRAHCREVFEQRFSVRRMAEEYTALYHQLTFARSLSIA